MARMLPGSDTAELEIIAEKRRPEAALELSVTNDESLDDFFGVDCAINAGISP